MPVPRLHTNACCTLPAIKTSILFFTKTRVKWNGKKGKIVPLDSGNETFSIYKFKILGKPDILFSEKITDDKLKLKHMHSKHLSETMSNENQNCYLFTFHEISFWGSGDNFLTSPN